jgi:hypothetical protein
MSGIMRVVGEVGRLSGNVHRRQDRDLVAWPRMRQTPAGGSWSSSLRSFESEVSRKRYNLTRLNPQHSLYRPRPVADVVAPTILPGVLQHQKARPEATVCPTTLISREAQHIVATLMNHMAAKGLALANPE